MTYYHRKLPHWQPDKAIFFITFRLAGSLPRAAIEKLKLEKKLLDQKVAKNTSCEESDKLSDLRKHLQLIFKKYEKHLDNADVGPTWLSKPKVAKIICEAIPYRDGEKYDLYSYCVMPNHIHMVIKMLEENKPDEIPALTKVLQNLKSYTALKANKVLDRSGSFWQSESFDRVIRNRKELHTTIRYILNNPVKARLVTNWQKWAYSFCKPELRNDFL